MVVYLESRSGAAILGLITYIGVEQKGIRSAV